MTAITITSWRADVYEAQVEAVLGALGIRFHRDDPEAPFVAALELGLSDGDIRVIDERGEIVLRTERAQILRNIAVAATRGELSISELVARGYIKRADLRDEDEG